MALDVSDTAPLTSVEQMVSYIADGEKSSDRFRIGTEHEKFPFYVDTLQPVPYAGSKGIESLLYGMQKILGWQPVMDLNHIIGLTDPITGAAISLEPGGQFELSGAPVKTLHQTCREVHAHFAQLKEVAEPLGIRFLGVGMSPLWTQPETPVMPKQRYKIMAGYMPKVGTRGLDMMFRTATVQVNLDYSSEADMVQKLRVGLALQPLATALFAASPFTEGKPNGFLSARSEIWRDTDNQRAGLLDFAFEEGMGYERYVDWALNVPLYFVKRDGLYYDVAGQSFRDLIAGTLPSLPGVRATRSDWVNHLSTLFPEVRLKKYLEMRGADAGPWRRLCALPAFWVGLLYDSGVLDEVYQLVKDWSQEERHYLRNTSPRLGLQTPFRGQTLQFVAREVLALSAKGLSRRGHVDSQCGDETRFLEPLLTMAESGRTLADEMLSLYHGAWHQKIEPVFESYVY